MISFVLANTPLSGLRSQAYGFFSNLTDNVIVDDVRVMNNYIIPPNPEIEDDVYFAILDGILMPDGLEGIIPDDTPSQARPNVSSAYYYELPGNIYSIKGTRFAEETPTYPVNNIIKEENGLIYYETDEIEFQVVGSTTGDQFTAPQVAITLLHGSQGFTGFGSQPTSGVNANYGLGVFYKIPAYEIIENSSSGTSGNTSGGNSGQHKKVRLLDFIYRFTQPSKDKIKLTNTEGVWQVAANKIVKDGVVLTMWMYGEATMSLYSGFTEAVLDRRPVLKIIRKKLGRFGLGLMLSQTFNPELRRWVLKDLDTNTILEDIDPIDFNNYSSEYIEVQVLDNTALYPITLKHSPIYMSYPNAPDQLFSQNVWEGFVMNKNTYSIILDNVPNYGWVGLF